MKRTGTLLATVVVIASCGSHKVEEHQVEAHKTDAVVKDTTPITVSDEVAFKFDFAVANIPSPAKIMNDLSSYGTTYNAAILNDTKRVAGYNTNFYQAINMGVYNLDMAYAIANNQSTDILKYFKASMAEADALGLNAAVNQMLGKRAEDNLNNKDSLFKIIDQVYMQSDTYLRTNQRVETAGLLFAGSWLEALYLICQTGSQEPDVAKKEKIHKYLWDQRFYLKNLIDLLTEFKAKKENTALIKELTTIHKDIEVIKDAKDITDKTFANITEKITQLRNNLTK